MEFRVCKRSNNFDACKNFYTSLGFEIKNQWDRSDLDKGAVFNIAHGQIEILLSEEPVLRNDAVYIYAEVTNRVELKRLFAKLNARETDLGGVNEIQETSWGYSQFEVKDPDGFILRFFAKE